MKRYLNLYLIMVCLLLPAIGLAQIADKIAALNAFNKQMPTEKLFVHLDKPQYTVIDTIWLKAYILDSELSYSKQSGIMYTELINDTGRVVIRHAMPVMFGVSIGQIALSKYSVSQGSYTLRAYTNWMQNQGEMSFFTRTIYVSEVNSNSWLVKSNSTLTKKQGVNKLASALQFTSNNEPLRWREMEFALMESNKTIARNNLQTDINGNIAQNFDLPNRGINKPLQLLASDLKKSQDKRKLIIPIELNSPGDIDLQFMPEGGSLVAGLQTKIGFKAIASDGKGVNVTGEIVDGKGVTVAQFKTLRFGTGNFELTPRSGENYIAKLTIPSGDIKTYPLPAVSSSGISMRINNAGNSDSVKIIINATADIINNDRPYWLIAQCGGKVCYAANVSFKNKFINGAIAKKRLTTGLTRFTLFYGDNVPMAERVIFIDHDNNLRINLNAAKTFYKTNDSVAIQIQVNDDKNKPVTGSFSLAITDDSQVTTDSTNVADIISQMLLTGDLKGYVEQPGYYFDKHNTDRFTALDNLLLTQGWIAYEWKDIFDPKFKAKYLAENEIKVSGTIVRLNKPQAGLTVTLLSTGRSLFLRDTITDSAGRFSFHGLPRMDSLAYLVKVKDKSGKIFEADIVMDKFEPAAISTLQTAGLTPWYVNTDTTTFTNNQRAIALQKVNNAAANGNGRQLKEVVINAKKIIKNSHNLNGPGMSDEVVDAEEIAKHSKATLYELLLKTVNGFGTRRLVTKKDDPTIQFFTVGGKQVKFVFDGMELDSYFRSMYDRFIDDEHYSFVLRNLAMFTAEDIKGIEVMYDESNNSRYKLKYALTSLTTNDCFYCTPPLYRVAPVYIEITTWSGNGLANYRVSSSFVYRPMAVDWPKQFYRPKYTTKGNAYADLRSTIHWEPNISTDSTGKATIWFGTKSKPGSYTAIIQGANLTGQVGVARKKLVVK